jgi:hypothetical protein
MVRYAFVLALVACESMPNPSANLTLPVQDAPSQSVAGAAGDLPTNNGGGFDFDADARSDEEEKSNVGELSDAELQARLLGVSGPVVHAPAPIAPAPVAIAAKLPVVSPAVLAPVAFDPHGKIPGSWGLRLVSTVLDADPPRAIIGFPDGHEEVVQAGTLLPNEGVAVMAIGNNAVQIAVIIPEGDHARIESRVISALFPQQPAPH